MDCNLRSPLLPPPTPAFLFNPPRPRTCNSYETLAAMNEKSRGDRENEEVDGMATDMTSSGAGGEADAASALRAGRARAARARRLRDKNEPCLLPDRLLHRVRLAETEDRVIQSPFPSKMMMMMLLVARR